MSPVLEHFAQLVADQVDDRLEVELGGHALLDAVDDRELGGALLGLLEQALRLVEEARVLERDAHAVGERLQQADVGLAERVLALQVDQVRSTRAPGRPRPAARRAPTSPSCVPGSV